MALFQAPYKITVPENTSPSSTIFTSIKVEDDDLVGDLLNVICEPLPSVKYAYLFGST